MKLPAGVTFNIDMSPEFFEILSYDALSFLAVLHRKFEISRQYLLTQRVERQKILDDGIEPCFLSETVAVRNGDWKIADIPDDLALRRVEITGPVEAKMIINALNSGADSFMADFEDSNSPLWINVIQGQINLKAAVRRTLTYVGDAEKQYKLNDKIATLVVRTRGWHLDEKHITIDGERVSASLFDFALFFFHNAKEQISRGTGPYFYLPKVENHQESKLWNDVFIFAQSQLGIKRGTIKATVLIENILAAFEMEEILFEMREHSSGLNAGRWDYIFSCIKKFKNKPEFCLAERSIITMTVPFMRAYALNLVKACHKRGAPAIGGMSALIPIKNNSEANNKALAGVRADKARDAGDGFDGGWVAHPGLVSIAMEEWIAVLGSAPNQIDRQRIDVETRAEDFLNFSPSQPITEFGLRMNINVGIQYLGAWLAGNGCVPIHNLMEDAATAEICRAQVWQWIRSPLGVLADGRKITSDLVCSMIPEILEDIYLEKGNDIFSVMPYKNAAQAFEALSIKTDFSDFLTTSLYEQL